MSLCAPSVWVRHLVRSLLIVQGTVLCCWGASQCPKLQFLTDVHGCQPCSLCKRSTHAINIREECSRTNPEPVADGRMLWCDNSRGPFPECPSLHPSVLQTPCSKSCTDNFRTFAPGCVCTVGCPGQPSQVVECTKRMQWNSTDIPSQCLSPLSSISPECPSLHPSVLQTPCSKSCTDNFRTFAPGCVCTVGCPGQPSQVVECTKRMQWNSTDIPSQCLSPLSSISPEPLTRKHHKSVPEDDVVMHIVLGSLVSIIVLVTAVVIILTCLYRRLRAKLCPPPSSGASGAPLLHSSGEKAQSGMKHGGNLTNGAVVIPMSSEKEVGEVPNIAVTETAGTQQRETGRQQDEDRHSIRALAALMNSRKDLLELSKMFDQKYAFDKITWHDVAVDLLGWDSNDMHHIEYKFHSLTGSPGDGPLYQVLEAARQDGKGLLDLIDCLRRQRKRQGGDQRCQETENVLIAFWQRWKAQQASEQPC